MILYLARFVQLKAGKKGTSDVTLVRAIIHGLLRRLLLLLKLPVPCLKYLEGLLINIHFLATNGLSMNKGAPFRGFSYFHDKKPVIIKDDLEEVSSLSATAST